MRRTAWKTVFDLNFSIEKNPKFELMMSLEEET